MSFKRKPPPGNARRVVSLGNNFRGVTTNKCGHLVQFESEQERKLILLLERDRTVSDFCSQPETICYQDTRGRQRRYTPDFQVWRMNGEIEWHEVTLVARREQGTRSPEREVIAQGVCQQRGWRYLVHTEQTLPSGYKYANLDFLAAFRAGSYADAEGQAWWQEHLDGQGQVHPQQVLTQAGSCWERGTLLNHLYYLIWHDQVQMDWQRPLIWQGDFHPAARIWLLQPPALPLSAGGFSPYVGGES